MNNTEASKFRFNGYIVKHSDFNFNGSISSNESLNINITPSGVKEKELFTLTLDIEIKNESNSISLHMITDSQFSFDKDLEPNQLGKFFTLNAPAIVFPYIRAYISMLSSLSGVSPILLPTLNLQNIGETLATKIIVKD